MSAHITPVTHDDVDAVVGMVYDQNERRVWCKDCEKDVDAFDAFVGLVEHYSGALKRLERDRKQVEEAKAFNVRSRAAKAINEAWRSRTMLPSETRRPSYRDSPARP